VDLGGAEVPLPGQPVVVPLDEPRGGGAEGDIPLIHLNLPTRWPSHPVLSTRAPESCDGGPFPGVAQGGAAAVRHLSLLMLKHHLLLPPC